MGKKQLYNDKLRKLSNKYGDVSVMTFGAGVDYCFIFSCHTKYHSTIPYQVLKYAQAADLHEWAFGLRAQIDISYLISCIAILSFVNTLLKGDKSSRNTRFDRCIPNLYKQSSSICQQSVWEKNNSCWKLHWTKYSYHLCMTSINILEPLKVNWFE